MFLSLKIMAVATVVTILLSTGTYFYGRMEGSAACDARHKEEALAEYMRRMDEASKLSEELEFDLTNSRNFYIDLRREIDREIASSNIYRDCLVPANGVFLANSAAQGRAAR